MGDTKPRTRKSAADKEYAMLAISKDLHKEVKTFCAENGITMICLVENLLRGYISKHSKGY